MGSKEKIISVIDVDEQYTSAVVKSNGAAAGPGPKRPADQSAVGGSAKKQDRKNPVPDMSEWSMDKTNKDPIFGYKNVEDNMVNFVNYTKTTSTDVVLGKLVSVETKEEDDIVSEDKIFNYEEFHKLAFNFVKFFACKHNYEYDILKVEWNMDDVTQLLMQIWEEDWAPSEDKNDCAYCGCVPDKLYLCEYEQRDACGYTNTICNTQFCENCGPIMVRDGELRFCKEHNKEDAIKATIHCIEEREKAEAFKKTQLKAQNERFKFAKYHDKKVLDPVQLVTGKGISSNQNIAKLLGCEPKKEYTAEEIRKVFVVSRDENGNPKLCIRPPEDSSEEEYEEDSSSEEESSEEEYEEDSSSEEESSEEESSEEESSEEESSEEVSSDASSSDEDSSDSD